MQVNKALHYAWSMCYRSTSGNGQHFNRVAPVPFEQAILFILSKKLWELWSFSKKNNTALTLPVKSWNCLFRHCLFSLSSNVNWWPQKALWTEVNRQPHERGSHLWSGQTPLTWSHHITILVEKMFGPVLRSWFTVLDFRLLVFGQMLVEQPTICDIFLPFEGLLDFCSSPLTWEMTVFRHAQ